MFSALDLHVSNGVAEIRLVRPQVLNRFDALLHTEFASVLNALRGDASVRSILLTSTGKVFSAGGDFDVMRAANASTQSRNETIQQAREVISALLGLPQPIVAAVQGPAIGLGATVVLACDAVVAARTASLSDAHVTMALAAGDGGALVWPQAAGMLRARRYLLTGDAIDAERAYQFGLVTDLVDTHDDVGGEARRLAERLASLPPLAVQGTKRALNQITAIRAGEVVEVALMHEAVTLASSDLLEAISAFLERRRADYSGT
ncbi:enoyl-CoA hydratase/isomerase family protein [Mycolicibacterium hodleri]|uniref:Enoyl-CoA hydratase/isomerase family protein n=1 Tax=Mycolicibacterium hodleri TaxID=49897 RepID=A0A502E3R7_9MYCO|nr:enoyl-CoA hydratase/isomerase family protein [Mycolicibacterium hodleri]TPG32408.1 enoyl-CoA hydratase/isomerase family protein [Mycolicibacterium hodleri]